MKLINHTKYDTRTLRRIMEVVRKNEKFVPPSWDRLVIEVVYARIPVWLRGRVLSYSALAGEARDTRMRLLEHTASALGEVAGCRSEDKTAVCSIDWGAPCPCTAWFEHNEASIRLNSYLTLLSGQFTTRSSAGVWDVKLSVPRHSLLPFLLAEKVDTILRYDADWDITCAVPWSQVLQETLGLGEELFEV